VAAFLFSYFSSSSSSLPCFSIFEFTIIFLYSVLLLSFLRKGLFSPSFLFLCFVFLLLPAIVFFSIYGYCWDLFLLCTWIFSFHNIGQNANRQRILFFFIMLYPLSSFSTSESRSISNLSLNYYAYIIAQLILIRFVQCCD
jgi:hypothetical protein